MESEASVSAKVVLLGPTGVGKTSLLMRHDGQGFSTKTSPTIGACYSRSIVRCGDEGSVDLQVWDTAGEERFRAMAPMYYRNACGGLGVLDVTKAESVEGVASFARELADRVEGGDSILVLVANKVDREKERVVSTSQVAALAQRLGAAGWVETSALTGTGVEKAFRLLATAILHRQPSWMDGPSFALEEEEKVVEMSKGCRC